MLEAFIAELLARYLGRYLRGITRDSLVIAIWNGILEFTDLELNTETDIPVLQTVAIKRGFKKFKAEV